MIIATPFYAALLRLFAMFSDSFSLSSLMAYVFFLSSSFHAAFSARFSCRFLFISMLFAMPLFR